MTMTENFFTGGTEFIITYQNGTHHIKEISYNDNGETILTVIFTGNYEKCLAEKQRIIAENFEYDLNL